MKSSATRPRIARSMAITPHQQGQQPESPRVEKELRCQVVRRTKKTSTPNYLLQVRGGYLSSIDRQDFVVASDSLKKIMAQGDLSCSTTSQEVARLLDPMAERLGTVVVDEKGDLTPEYYAAAPSVRGLMLSLQQMKVESDTAIMRFHRSGLRQAASMADGLLTLVHNYLSLLRDEAGPLELLYCARALSVTSLIYAGCVEKGVGTPTVMADRFRVWSDMHQELSMLQTNLGRISEINRTVIAAQMPAKVQDHCFGAAPLALVSAERLIRRGMDLGRSAPLFAEVSNVIASHLQVGSVPVHEHLWSVARTNRRNYEAWSGAPV